jgi:hypothetical protein
MTPGPGLQRLALPDRATVTPSADAAADVRRQAHGLVTNHIYQVQEGS